MNGIHRFCCGTSAECRGEDLKVRESAAVPRFFLNFLFAFLFLGVVVLASVATGSLLSAVKKAGDGFEDDGGFHEGFDEVA